MCTQKTPLKQKIFYLFYSGCHETSFNALFWMITLGHICSFFAFVFVASGIEVFWHQENKQKIIKPKFIYD